MVNSVEVALQALIELQNTPVLFLRSGRSSLQPCTIPGIKLLLLYRGGTSTTTVKL